MPDPTLPPGCVCHKCGVELTTRELKTFSVACNNGSSKGYASHISISLKWGPHACGHKQRQTVNNEGWDKMLAELSEPDQARVRKYVKAFYLAKKEAKLQADEEESEKAGRKRKFWK